MIKVAVIGHGYVGSGVAELLLRREAQVSKVLGEEVKLAAVCDVKPLRAESYADLYVKDFSVIENDPEINIVVETIGGIGAALDFTRRSLNAGKHVVSSNKELVAVHGAELLALAQSRNVNYLFEASVGGGIPVITPMTDCMTGNNITDIIGILNGTTNYILTGMGNWGMALRDALAEAQVQGYAEQNPTDDVEGKDAARKISILASLAFGRHVRPEWVPTQGIMSITKEQIKEAADLKMTIKLLGRAKLFDDGKIAVLLAPHLVPENHPLHSIADVFNAIVVTGDAVGDVMFYGRGAGKLPTASAVIADIMDCVRYKLNRKPIFWTAETENFLLPESAFAYEKHIFADGSQMRILL